MGKRDKARRVKGGVLIGEGHREVFMSDSLIKDMDNYMAVGDRKAKVDRVREWLRRAYRLDYQGNRGTALEGGPSKAGESL